jgi:hypothetical protein
MISGLWEIYLYQHESLPSAQHLTQLDACLVTFRAKWVHRHILRALPNSVHC